jgi:hypothetical protein
MRRNADAENRVDRKLVFLVSTAALIPNMQSIALLSEL